MKKFLVIILLILILGTGVFLLFHKTPELVKVEPAKVVETFTHKVIGKSVQGRDIESFTFGNGNKNIVFVGGIHGVYEKNSSDLAYEFLDYLKVNPTFVPTNTKVTIIPNLNPDATNRFNTNNVDLNRNFDCNWKSKSIWQNKIISAGTAPFSEPEALALKNFVEENKPNAFIFWHSKANAVYASKCDKGILPQTLDIMNAYAKASDYSAIKSFDAYPVTGAAEDWLAKIGIPAITVELKNHETTEWDKNITGIKAVLDYYNKIK